VEESNIGGQRKLYLCSGPPQGVPEHNRKLIEEALEHCGPTEIPNLNELPFIAENGKIPVRVFPATEPPWLPSVKDQTCSQRHISGTQLDQIQSPSERLEASGSAPPCK
jgi:hypothetical protein